MAEKSAVTGRSPRGQGPTDAKASPRKTARPARLAAAGARIASRSESLGSDEKATGGTESGANKGPHVHFSTAQPSSLAPELSRGYETLIQQLANVSANNLDLQRRLENQNKEVSLLQLTSIDQQRLLLALEQQVESTRKAEVQAAETKAIAKAGDERQRLRSELDACQKQLQQSRQERQTLAEQLDLARLQLTRETEARRQAEAGALATEQRSEQREQELQSLLEGAARELLALRQQLSEQGQLLHSREEQCADIEARYQRHRRKARQQLSHEKEKLDVVSRLDGMLPRSILLKAVSDD
eukprot:TRINITY_DN10746_c0_g2_i1.p1 TRINITY_DN10746_c0_g2~~TRINITY_DN10746_c0_g2_i1.p1  ORF type:complete len:300 (+),score=74.93 TRINITY_DN10746_c0_g2_i1:123-1022(+)